MAPETVAAGSSRAPPNTGRIRMRSAGLPERDALAFMREEFIRSILRVDVELREGSPFRSDCTIDTLPGLCVIRSTSSPLTVTRTKGLLQDGDDRFLLQMAVDRTFSKQPAAKRCWSPATPSASCFATPAA